MVKMVLITGLLFTSLGALGQYGYPGMYNPFPVYLWEQELYRREVRELTKMKAECQSITDAWHRAKPKGKVLNGLYTVYGVSETNDDWRRVEVVVIKQKIIQMGSQQITDSSKISKGRASATVSYKDGPSTRWYFYFIQ
jgi:hypothetical protein